MIQQLPLFLKVAATVAVTVIGSSNIINISQTYQLQQKHKSNGGITPFLENEKIAYENQKQSLPTQEQSKLFTLSQIKSMSRHDLVRLYLSSNCYAPTTLADISGEWNGKLLENNGRVMVSSI